METNYDAIVVGTGISGGWAAKELCEKGLKTLVLERGRMVNHVEDYPTMHNDPWDYRLGMLSQTKPEKIKENKVEPVTLQLNRTSIFLLMIINIHIMKRIVLTGCVAIMLEVVP